MQIQKTSVNSDSVDAKFSLTQIKLKVLDFLYAVILNKSFGLFGSLPDLDNFFCQIESGLTEVYCTLQCDFSLYIKVKINLLFNIL